MRDPSSTRGWETYRSTEARAGPCRLCETSTDLRRSHVLPEFLFTPTYQEEHGKARWAAEAEVGRTRVRKIQKGYRERLLCADCEAHLSRWEKHAADVLRRLRREFAAHAGGMRGGPGQGSPVITLGDVRYEDLKLFALSLLWRCSVTTLPQFDAVHLGPNEKPVRKRVIEGSPGEPDEYPLFLFFSPGVWNLLEDAYIVPPWCKCIDGNRVYVLAAAGMFWLFYPTERPPGVPKGGSSLTRDGKLHVLISNNFVKSLLRDLRQAIREAGHRRGEWPPESP